MGSLGWFVCSFRCDPGLHVAVVCQKQKGCLVAIWTTALENCAARCLLAENLKPREIFHGGILVSNYSIIGVTLNTKLDTLWLSQVGGPMEGLTKKYDTSPES